MNLTQRQINAFLALVEYQSYGKASEKLKISQSGLSRIIQSLESELDTKLFKRSTKSIVLTENGERTLPVVKRIFNDLQIVKYNLTRNQPQEESSIRIGVDPSFANSVMSRMLAPFLKLFPHVTVHVDELSSQLVLRKIQDRELDFGICSQTNSVPQLCSKPILLSPIGLFFNPAKFSLAQSLKTEDFIGCPLIRVQDGLEFNREALDFFSSLRAELRAPIVVSSTAMQFSLVRAGLGVAVLSALDTLNPGSSGLRFSAIEPVLYHETHFVFRREEALSESSQSLIKMIIDLLPYLRLHPSIKYQCNSIYGNRASDLLLSA
jgi:DNA-binding transcriptional LysR family regulator